MRITYIVCLLLVVAVTDSCKTDCVKPSERVLPPYTILQYGKKYLPANVRANIIFKKELLYCRVLPWEGTKNYRFVLLYKTIDAGYVCKLEVYQGVYPMTAKPKVEGGNCYKLY